MGKTNFFKRVYSEVQKIPSGKVMTYGQIARRLRVSSRTVGWALHANKDSSNVPCHRVVNKDGRVAPGYAFGGPNKQKMHLLVEGVMFVDDDHIDLQKCLWNSVR